MGNGEVFNLSDLRRTMFFEKISKKCRSDIPKWDRMTVANQTMVFNLIINAYPFFNH